VDRGVLVVLVKWSASVPWNAEAQGDESKGRVEWNMNSKECNSARKVCKGTDSLWGIDWEKDCGGGKQEANPCT
jgi:hypothetical protein